MVPRALRRRSPEGPGHRPPGLPRVLVVPKPTHGKAAPFPVVVWVHDDDAYAEDALVYGADYARQGIAFFAFSRPGFGPVPPNRCVPLSRGAGSSGENAPWWTGHVTHDRDRLRQAAVDALEAVRVLDAGKIAEVRGPIYAPRAPAWAGLSRRWSGRPSRLSPPPRPSRRAGASPTPRSAPREPIAPCSARGCTRRRRRSSRARPARREERSVRFGDAEIACLSRAELQAGFTVVVTNVTKRITRCGLAGQDGRLSSRSSPTDAGDRLDVQVYDAPEVVSSYATCRAKRRAPVGRRIQTFERAGSGFAAGDWLVATTSGLGLRRQSPELRRFRDLAQALLDPADPTAFATRYMLEPRAALERPRRRVAPAPLDDHDR